MVREFIKLLFTMRDKKELLIGDEAINFLKVLIFWPLLPSRRSPYLWMFVSNIL